VDVAVVGVTASGKSQVALDVVRTLRTAADPHRADPRGTGGPTVDVELVSVDSMAVYRGMDIGTTKPSPEVRAEVRYHLVDLVDPHEEFTVTRFQEAARTAVDGIATRGHRSVLVGGTGLYLRAVTDGLEFPGRFADIAAGLRSDLDARGPAGSPERAAAVAGLHERLRALDPVAASRTETGNERRLVRALEVTLGSGRPFSSFGPGLGRYPPTTVALVGVRHDPADTDRRIGERFARMMDAGLLDEVRALSARPGGLSRTARQALGYRELLGHVEQSVPLAEAVEEAVRRTRRFARRQWAWFRRDPRIQWVDPGDDPVPAVIARLEGPTRPPEPVRDCRSTP